MPQETIFSKIIRREIPADVVYQDELVTAFRDITPQAPTHILIIPNKIIPTVNDVSAEDEQMLGRLFVVAAKIAQQQGIAGPANGAVTATNAPTAQKPLGAIRPDELQAVQHAR